MAGDPQNNMPSIILGEFGPFNVSFRNNQNLIKWKRTTDQFKDMRTMKSCGPVMTAAGILHY